MGLPIWKEYKNEETRIVTKDALKSDPTAATRSSIRRRQSINRDRAARSALVDFADTTSSAIPPVYEPSRRLPASASLVPDTLSSDYERRMVRRMRQEENERQNTQIASRRRLLEGMENERRRGASHSTGRNQNEGQNSNRRRTIPPWAVRARPPITDEEAFESYLNEEPNLGAILGPGLERQQSSTRAPPRLTRSLEAEVFGGPSSRPPTPPARHVPTPPTTHRRQVDAADVTLPGSPSNGLGDRMRSPSPISNNGDYWEIMRDTIPLDDTLPSLDSSFASAAAAATFTSANVYNPDDQSTAADHLVDSFVISPAPRTDDQDCFYPSPSDAETEQAPSSTRIYGDRVTIESEPQTYLERAYANYLTRNGPPGPDPSRFSDAVHSRNREANAALARYHNIERRLQAERHASRIAETRSDMQSSADLLSRVSDSLRRDGSDDTDVEHMRGILDALARRQDVPEEWWMAAGLSPEAVRDSTGFDGTRNPADDEGYGAD